MPRAEQEGETEQRPQDTTAHEAALSCLPLPTPYPVGAVNTYLLNGPEPVLVDTGVYSSLSLHALAAGLASHGLAPTDLRHIILTHGHFDHAGAALHLSRLAGATLYHAPRCILFPQERDATQRQLGDFLGRAGMPRESSATAFAIFEQGRRFALLEAEPCAQCEIRDGEELHFPGLRLRVLATPGHSPDSLCLLNPDSGHLLAGDTLLPHITPNPMLHLAAENGFRRRHSLLEYLASLDKLAACEAQSAYPGHGPLITDIPGLIARNRAATDERQRKLLAAWPQAHPTPFELSLAVFGPRDVVNQFLAVSEIVAHLDLLERNGQVRVDWEEDPITMTRL